MIGEISCGVYNISKECKECKECKEIKTTGGNTNGTFSDIF